MPPLVFYPPLAPTVWVARKAGIGGGRGLVMSTLAGRLAYAAYARRRVPARYLRSRITRRSGEHVASAAWTSGERLSFRGALVVAVGPGERDGLTELIESVRHFEGEDVKVVVVDDHTGEYPDRVVAREFPGVDFVRPTVPSGTALCTFRNNQVGLLHVVRRYDAPTILKTDPDALMIAPGAFALARARFDADPGLGLLGTTDRNASGRATDYRWSGWMAHTELRWSRRLRRLLGEARRRVPDLGFAQGGAYFLAAEAVKAASDRGVIPFRQPAWSLLTEDLITDLVVQAAGYRVGSFGAPGEPIASDTDRLPLEPAQLLDGGFKIAHSVRSTPSGGGEADVRAFFREARNA
jgi:hypothetical protein